MTDLVIPKGCGICPVCNGSTRVPVESEYSKYKTMYRDYDAATDTLACRNCGGQTMSGNANGYVRLDKDGAPCTHHFLGRVAGRCYTVYTCDKCGSSYDIDSGD